MEEKQRRQRYLNRRRTLKKRRGRRDAVSITILVVSLVVLLFAASQLIISLSPYLTGSKEYNQLRELVLTADEVGDGFTIDFDMLLNENPDTVAWLRFEEPEIISYPVVQGEDNSEYLTKTFSANDNKLGAIFMDVRNTSFEDRNVFIYGHNLKVGGEMFSQLNAYAEEEFCKEHPCFFIYTPDGKVRAYKVFSAGVVKATADNYKSAYRTEENFIDYLNLCKNSSNYNVDVELNTKSKIVTWSTCTNVRSDERFLVQGVLVSED